jgi:hypothetical protein
MTKNHADMILSGESPVLKNISKKMKEDSSIDTRYSLTGAHVIVGGNEMFKKIEEKTKTIGAFRK